MRGRTSARVMQVAHSPRVAALEPILQMRKLRKLRGGSDAAEIESRCACELNGPPSEIGVRHGSILLGQAPACLVLILAAPAEDKRRQSEAYPTRESCTIQSRNFIQRVARNAQRGRKSLP